MCKTFPHGFLLLAALFFITQLAIAQTPSPNWVNHISGQNYAGGQAVAVDQQGNIVITGWFKGTMNIGDITLASAGGTDIFIAKFDDKGEVLWAKSAGSAKNFDEGFDIATDTNDNIIVVGRFGSTITFDTITLTGNVGMFLVKLTPDGHAMWAIAEEATGYAVAVDTKGNTFVTGELSGSSPFGLSPGEQEMFIAKYDASGHVLWLRQGGGSSTDQGYAVTTDERGNVFVAGRFASKIATFSDLTIKGSSTYDMFVAHYDAFGNLQWLRHATRASAWGIGVDNQNNCYVAGNFYGTSKFDPITLKCKQYDMFIAKYDATGEMKWVRQAGAQDYAMASGLAIDAEGRVIVIGEFHDRLFAGHTKLSAPGVFLIKYDPNGWDLWAQQIRGTRNITGHDIAIDHSGNSVMVGEFNDTANFNTVELKSAGGSDTFLASLREPGPEVCIPLPAQQELGRIKHGDESHLDEVCYSFKGKVGNWNLLYQMYDIDKKNEVDIYLNGRKLRREKPTGNLTWSSTRALLLGDDEVVDDSENHISFVNRVNAQREKKHYWGVRSVSLAPCIPLPYRNGVGRIKLGDRTHINDACFSFEGQSGDFVLSYQVFDIDDSNEVDILLNGEKILNVAQGQSDGWSETRSLLLLDEMIHDQGLNVIVFDAVRNPSRRGWWGVRQIEVIANNQNIVVASGDGDDFLLHKSTGTSDKQAVSNQLANLPADYQLDQNYPNPFSPLTRGTFGSAATTIRFALPQSERVVLTIYNLNGELVHTLVKKDLPPGYHEFRFEASDLATGMYLYRLQAGEFIVTRKMLFAR